jgi:hypothetical protein
MAGGIGPSQDSTRRALVGLSQKESPERSPGGCLPAAVRLRFPRHGRSFATLQEKQGGRWAAPLIVAMSLRPAIPQRVARQQSPPPLHRLEVCWPFEEALSTAQSAGTASPLEDGSGHEEAAPPDYRSRNGCVAEVLRGSARQRGGVPKKVLDTADDINRRSAGFSPAANNGNSRKKAGLRYLLPACEWLALAHCALEEKRG